MRFLTQTDLGGGAFRVRIHTDVPALTWGVQASFLLWKITPPVVNLSCICPFIESTCKRWPNGYVRCMFVANWEALVKAGFESW